MTIFKQVMYILPALYYSDKLLPAKTVHAIPFGAAETTSFPLHSLHY